MFGMAAELLGPTGLLPYDDPASVERVKKGLCCPHRLTARVLFGCPVQSLVRVLRCSPGVACVARVQLLRCALRSGAAVAVPLPPAQASGDGLELLVT